MSFAETFVFSRPVPAPFVDPAGVTQIAAPDRPRFDNAGPRRPRGLLVEAGPLGQGDRVRLVARDWSAASEWTILHEWEDAAGIRRDAHYGVQPGAMIDGVLRLAGHHRRIAAIAGYLTRYGAWVWALGARWYLPGLVADTQATPIASDATTPLTGS